MSENKKSRDIFAALAIKLASLPKIG